MNMLDNATDTTRKILKQLCRRMHEQKIPLSEAALSPDNAFSFFGVIGKEVMYCRVLLYLIRNFWYSFEKSVLVGCCDHEPLLHAENEYACDAPCKLYNKEGRIDILLETEGHVVAIEAKLGAEDQAHQLIRYQKGLEHVFRKKAIHIFYLTVDGRSASENATSCDRCDKNCKVEACKEISFRENIYHWLKSLRDSSARYNDIATQFMEVLELERGTNEREYIHLLKESSEYPMVIQSLSSALPKLWQEIRQTFFHAVSEKLTTQFGFKEIDPVALNREICGAALIKDNKPLYICYAYNLFLRIGPLEDDIWTYIQQACFQKNCVQYETSTKTHDAICLKNFAPSNHGLVDWYYRRETDEGKDILDCVARSINALHTAR